MADCGILVSGDGIREGRRRPVVRASEICHFIIGTVGLGDSQGCRVFDIATLPADHHGVGSTVGCRGVSQRQRIGGRSIDVDTIAQRAPVLVPLIVQVNAGRRDRENRRPGLVDVDIRRPRDDLRESADECQTADQVRDIVFLLFGNELVGRIGSGWRKDEAEDLQFVKRVADPEGLLARRYREGHAIVARRRADLKRRTLVEVLRIRRLLERQCVLEDRIGQDGRIGEMECHLEVHHGRRVPVNRLVVVDERANGEDLTAVERRPRTAVELESALSEAGRRAPLDVVRADPADRDVDRCPDARRVPQREICTGSQDAGRQQGNRDQQCHEGRPPRPSVLCRPARSITTKRIP